MGAVSAEFYKKLTNTPAGVIVALALMLFFGYAATRITKRLRLPNVTGYILAGILLGPFCLNWVPRTIIEGTDFLADIALAFIAFSVGEFFKLDALKKSGAKAAVITLFEACAASAVVFAVTFWVLRLDLAFSIVLGALAAATAPASTIMTIRQTGAKGDFVDTLLQVVAMDDVVGLVLYSVAISVAVSAVYGGGGSALELVVKPVAINLLVLALGGGFAFLLRLLMPQGRSTDNRLIISVGGIFLFCGICALLDVSPLLGCMAMGMVYINISGDEKLFQQLNYFTPPILLLFFVRSGLSFDLGSLGASGAVDGKTPLVAVGVVYFFARMFGKYAGAFVGCAAAGKCRETRNYLGLALVPQAGVAIGLAALCARTLGGEVGRSLETIILASSVLYELIGPACAKLSLYLSHAYSNKLEEMAPVAEVTETGAVKTPVELLIERLQQIQAELPDRDEGESPEERAFLEAADEQWEALGPIRGRFLNRR